MMLSAIFVLLSEFCLFYLETALRVSGGTTTHHQQRIPLYLQHLVFVRPLLLLTAIVPTPPR